MSELIEEDGHEVIDALKNFDLNSYEARTYVALLEQGEAQAVEISDKAGVPKSRVYDVLGSLEKKGMITKEPTTPTVYSANHARRVLETLVYRIEKSNEERVSYLRNQIEEVTDELPERGQVEQRTDAVRVIEGTYSVACKLIEGMQDVEETMDIAGDSPFVRLKSRSAFDNQIGSRPVDIRALGVFDGDTIDEMERHGAEVKHAEDATIQSYFIFDGTRLLQVSVQDDGTPRGLITEEHTLVRTYTDRFERLWDEY